MQTPIEILLVRLGERLKDMAQGCLDEATRLGDPDPWTLRESANRGGPSASELIANAERQADMERYAARIYHGIARIVDAVRQDVAQAEGKIGNG